ncbi:nitroreductase family protein [Pedobacter cryotolerans]|uniref:Putative NAD(P)H nitroreductase n=1 Tax=Pedobacter cryotolerans TaxID=2571270 RepID=A0A4U1CBY5_9SPHI|nr:nitroreductase [Pedobacter cryotolerans]TKC01300.1 nitroreductase [Pedobacter cryotolerans]
MSTPIEILTSIIKHRRSIYPDSYLEKEIPKEAIEQILENANYAPTHKLTEPWRFVVLTGNAKAKLGLALGEFYKKTIPAEKFLQKKFDSFSVKTQQAPCIIAINMKVSGKIPEWEELAAVSCAVQNMALSAQALNIGAYWSSPPLIDHLQDFLSLSSDEKCIGLFYMGYHNETSLVANRTPIEEKVIWMES